MAAPVTASGTFVGMAETLHTTFGGLSIAYDDDVIEPRSWTEAQSRWAADLLAETDEGDVLELCSGAGHIGLLAVLRSPHALVQVDLNPTACAFARQNAAAAGAVGVRVLEGPIDATLDPDDRFVGVIADPPWVPTAETSRFPEDPVLAIDGGREGVDLARTCVEVAARHLVDGGWVLLQIGTAEQVSALEKWLGEPGSPRLGMQEVRTFGERGVLVLLG